MQRLGQGNFKKDNHATLFDSYYSGDTTPTVSYSSLQSYQWRIGGRYFPAAPVQLSLTLGNGICNGGAEAFIELEKALNIVGDYRLSTGLNACRWAIAADVGTNGNGSQPNRDFVASIYGWIDSQPRIAYETDMILTTGSSSFAGTQGSCAFVRRVTINLKGHGY